MLSAKRRLGAVVRSVVVDYPELDSDPAGAACFVLDANRFRIITDSWNKTDKHDARNLAKALWVFLATGEFGIPTVYKPSETIRTLRRLLRRVHGAIPR